MEKKVQIILVEDDMSFADNVKSCIKEIPESSLCQQYISCEDALNSNSLSDADILLLDINLPGIDGLEGIPRFLQINPELNIIIISILNHDSKLFKALQMGAKGYLLKTDCFMHLKTAIQEVMLGGMLFSPQMAAKVLKYFKRKPLLKVKLTKREKEVLKLLKTGISKKEIATKLQISYGTVDSHVKNIYKKLHVKSNVQAAKVAMESGII